MDTDFRWPNRIDLSRRNPMIDPDSKTMRQIAVESPVAIAALEKYSLEFCWASETNRSKPQPPKPAFRWNPYCAR